jgi:hypothetical protein
MKKLISGILVVAVLAIALVSAGFVYAQTVNPPTPVPGSGYGPGMMGGRGGRGGMMGANAGANGQYGILHEEMTAAFALKLGISETDLDARLEKGETMAQIASSKGLTAEQFQALMTDARAQAIDQAVKSGKLTQEQADWMKQRGMGQGMGGGRGRGGQGRFSNPDCPYYQTNP